MRINPFVMPVLVLAALFGTVWTAQAMGRWTTSGRVAIDPSTMTPADLKGWMTLQEVMNGLDLSQADLYAAAKLPADIPPSTALNKLEGIVPGFSVTALRDILTAKLAGSTGPATKEPVERDTAAGTATPAPAPVSTPAATLAKASSENAGTGPTPSPPGQILPASQIKGSMTLKSVSEQCGVPLAQVLAGLGLPAETNPDALLKDLVAQGKIGEVTNVQEVVAGLQNQ